METNTWKRMQCNRMLKHNIIASKLKVIMKALVPLMVQIVLLKQIMLFGAIFKYRFTLTSKGILS
jgi:hypothetical protein